MQRRVMVAIGAAANSLGSRDLTGRAGRVFAATFAACSAGGAVAYAAASDETRAQWFAKTHQTRERIEETIRYYTEPSHERLLPDLVSYPGVPPVRTLVIDLNDTLVHSTWSRSGGWRTTKRPGVEAFLAYLSSFYEIVVFTSDLNSYADPILEALDPNGYVVHRLYRHATRFRDGVYIKDLANLNRDLSRVVIVDTKAEHIQAQPENAILLPEWRDNVNDRELISLIPFLESIVRNDVRDVRELLKSYEGKHIPTEFQKRQAEEASRAHGGRFGIAGFSGSSDSPRGRRAPDQPPTTVPEGSIWGSLRRK